MIERPMAAEGWIELINTTLTDATPVVSEAYKLSTGAVEHGGGLIGVEIDVAADDAVGTTDDMTIEVFTCPDGVIGDINSVAKYTHVLAVSGGAVRETFYLDWETLCSGFAVAVTMSGTTDDIVTVVRMRRFKWRSGG